MRRTGPGPDVALHVGGVGGPRGGTALARVWQLACPVDHVAAPGDFFEHRVGRLSVLVVRGDDGELRAFQNVCRHRGNPLCEGSGGGLTELRCGFHRWTVGPARRAARGAVAQELRRAAQRGRPAARGGGRHLGSAGLRQRRSRRRRRSPSTSKACPKDIDWVGLDDFRCTSFVEVPVVANWKAAVDGFSETYHLQGLHREMLPIVDDVDAPAAALGPSRQVDAALRRPEPAPRREVTDQQIWDAFILVMGTRIGIPTDAEPGARRRCRTGRRCRR